MEIWQILATFFVGLFTSFYGTSIGGAGFVMIPFLIFMGLSPQETAAVIIVSYTGALLTGFQRFKFHGKIDKKIAIPATVTATIGGVIGAVSITRIPAELLKVLMGIFIILISVFMLLKPKLNLGKINLRLKKGKWAYFVLMLIGAYSTTVVGGSSILVTYTLVLFFGKTFLEAAGTRKPIFLGINLVSGAIFLLQGLVHLQFTIILFIANCLGSYLGVDYAIKKGERYIRICFITVSILSALKLIF